jgi:glutamyl-tRNA synthetase
MPSISVSDPVTSPRVRFAPSPTGYLHVGGARTALFNWLFARHFGGTLVLRIEDTDLERSTPEMVEGILQGMRWLGLDWDEGPYYQTQRVDLYRSAADKLLESDAAYYCFCSKEDLEQRRKKAAAEGRPPKYEGICRKLYRAEAASRKAASEAAAVRFAIPQGGSTSFNDAVFGKVEFANSELEDFVLLRSDGNPTYHLSVVADDIDLRITHIIRGADHISNTPKQALLYQALGAALPVFAHVPLILGADKTRLSKRHGATSVMAYSDEGIVPEAFRNFLALLGWTPPEGTSEILGDAELVRLFGVEGISRSNAVFDRAKLDWFNTEYIRAYPAERLLPLIEEEWRKVGLHVEIEDERSSKEGGNGAQRISLSINDQREPNPAQSGTSTAPHRPNQHDTSPARKRASAAPSGRNQQETSPDGAKYVSPGHQPWVGGRGDQSPVRTAQDPGRQWLLSTIDLLKPRARSLKDFAGSFRAFFTDDFEPDPAAVEKFLKDAQVRQLLVELGKRYAALQDFTEAETETILRDFAAEKGVKAGALINGARVALTGQGVAPSLFAVMVALGQPRTAARLQSVEELANRVLVRS